LGDSTSANFKHYDVEEFLKLEGNNYKLHAFITFLPGHYTSTVRDLNNENLWHFFDDEFHGQFDLKNNTFNKQYTYDNIFNKTQSGFFKSPTDPSLPKQNYTLKWQKKGYGAAF
jgi:hypothetical protein